MAHHILILWDTETNKAVYSELVKKPDYWMGVLLHIIGEVYRLGFSDRIEIIHSSGISSQTKTFRRDEIEEIGRCMEEAEEK